MEKRLRRQYIYEGSLINLRIDTVVTASGHHTTREIVEHGDAVAVVALDPDDNVLLIKQFRTPLGKDLLEVPAGLIEKKEETEAAVIREMQEEIGYRPEKLCLNAPRGSVTPELCPELLRNVPTTQVTDLLRASKHRKSR